MNTGWNRDRLERLASSTLRAQKLIVVSCRSPYIHERIGGHVQCLSPAGGVTAALKPTMAAVGGTWVAQASGSADRETASAAGRLRVPPEKPEFGLRRLCIPAGLRRGHYEGLSNQALWPLCHNVYQRPVFRDADWSAYRRVNEIFAQAVLEETHGQPAVVFIQDYHFALLPRLLKSANPALTVGQFWHIPFPTPEVAQIFPWLADVLDGLLGNDLIGFHLPQHRRNFFDAVTGSVEALVDRHKQAVWLNDHRTIVRDVPISIDFDEHTRDAASAEVEHAMTKWKQRIGGARHLGLGIDRLDYTKGIPERLRALASLFDRNPEWRGRLTFLQVGVPSRSTIPEYASLEKAIESEVMRINLKWGSDDWTPVLFEKRNLPPVEMMALHRLARFCLVTPLHDGMNLVAKEFVASRFDSDGVLILSRFAGAAQEIESALQVNPFSETELRDAIGSALAMSKSERQARMAAARTAVEKNNVYRWAGELLGELGFIALGQGRPAAAQPFGRVSMSVA
jgi:trehalose 6-phosphate synthase